ncbi:MAG: Gfo/Idh/MocA family oxidoreductase [Kiritimatiellae bacterium]|nr:Gfo/Idh/MocA family oxidoreductase [Kiritimatiellia bacterium]
MLKIGVVGYGHRSSGLVNRYLLEEEPDARVAGVVDPDEANARARLPEADRNEAVFYTTLPEMLRKAKLDGIIVGPRCNLHTPYAIEASRFDVPMFLEKPVAISMAQATALERAFEKSKCPVVVSFPLRLSPLCALAREQIAGGAVGKPEHILAVNYVTYGAGFFEQHYRNYQVTQGLFLQKATHDFDAMSYLMDSPIVKVAATASWGRVYGGKKPAGLKCSQCREAETCPESPANRRKVQEGSPIEDLMYTHLYCPEDLKKRPREDHLCPFSVDCGTPEKGMNEDSSSALVEFKNGAKGVYTQVFYACRPARGATVSGYKGAVSFDWYKNNLKLSRRSSSYTDTISGGHYQPHFGGDRELIHDFIRVMKGGKKIRATLAMGIQSVYACLAAKESALKGRFINVRQVGQEKDILMK